MKEEIRAKSKKAADKITAEQRGEIFKQSREECKQAFLAQIAASSDTQTANATWGGSLHLDMIFKDYLFTMPTNNDLWKFSLHKYIFFNSVNSVITFVFVIARQTLKNNIPLDICTLSRRLSSYNLIPVDTYSQSSKLQWHNTTRCLQARARYYKKRSLFHTIPGYQLRIDIFSAA